jgi:hypothetical protein
MVFPWLPFRLNIISADILIKPLNMRFSKTFFPKILVITPLFLILMSIALQLKSQDLRYDPKGNPDKWNFNITPFLILPWVNGNVQSEMLSQEFGIDPADFVNSLNGTFMINTELSKGKFFVAPSYIYLYNEVAKILWTSGNGNQTITAEPAMQKHIMEMIAGMRFRMGTKFMLDPYLGFRYTMYHLFGSVQGIANTNEFDEHVDFWDPVLGFKAHLYLHPRIPIELKADIGGFGVGSKLTWSTWFNIGYTVSPTVDLLAGFAALSNQYESETASGRTYGMTSLTYGISVGARFFIPSRAKDPVVFKKFNQKD